MTQGDAIAVVGAKLHAMTGPAPIPNATVVIKGGRFVAVGVGLAPPDGARVIEGRGRAVTPGLMAAGSQLGLVEVGSIADCTDHSVSAGPLGAGFDVQYALNANSTLLPRARADGLTRAVAYPGASAGAPFAGMAAILRLSEGQDILDRPRVALFAITGGMAAAAAGGSRAAQWLGLRSALDEAKAWGGVRRGGGPRGQRLGRLDAEALQGVLSGATPLAIVAARESDIRQAVAVARDYGVRVIVFGGAEAWRAGALLAEHGVPVVLNPFDNVPATFDEIGARLENAAMLHTAGVTIAFSTPGIHLSHNAGSAVREAAGLAVANGLPWGEALKAVTVNPATIWKMSGYYGTVTPGMDADLVIWDGDPLEPASSPATVLVRGEEVSLVSRQSLLAERYHPRHRDDPWPPAYR